MDSTEKELLNYDLEQSATRCQEDSMTPDGSISHQIETFCSEQVAWFTTTLAYESLQLERGQPRKTGYQALLRLQKAGVLERHPKRAGTFRRMNIECPIMNWWDATTEEYEMELPLFLEKEVIIYPGEIGIIAGEKNSSKTALLMWMAYLNRDHHKVYYNHSELNRNQLKVRIRAFETYMGTPEEEWKKITFRSRLFDFAPIIEPDHLNICDYLHRTDEFFLMGDDVEAIYKKMYGHKGYTMIAIQKQKGNEWGLGGQIPVARPNLYLTLFSGEPSQGQPNKLKVKICKSPRGESASNKSCEFFMHGEGSEIVPASDGWSYEPPSTERDKYWKPGK